MVTNKNKIIKEYGKPCRRKRFKSSLILVWTALKGSYTKVFLSFFWKLGQKTFVFQ